MKVSVLTLAILFLSSMLGATALAQVGGYGIPSTYEVFGESVLSGDIISFNPVSNIYERSRVPRDETMFGVVDVNPVVVFRSRNDNFPIVQVGEVLVNVTNKGGSIAIGDKITSSEIDGKGQVLNGNEGFILGIALQSFDGTSGTTTIFHEGSEYTVRPIRVLLSIGPAIDTAQNSESQSTIFVRQDVGETETGLETIFRYLTALVFALGTIFFVFKAFGPNIGKGVVSIGRNPLAKTSIQAMVVFNVILILSISIVGFAIAVLIIFLPV